MPACPICGSDATAFHKHDGFHLLRCLSGNCGHVWVENMPHEGELAQFYETNSSELWNSAAFTILDDYKKDPQAVCRYYRRERLDCILRNVPTLRPAAQWLDVGCSTGAFLACLRDSGFIVTGQDIGGPAVEAGRQAFGLDLHGRPLNDCDFQHKFDVVSCIDVIEHVPDPRALVRSVRAVTAEQGSFFVRTPNHASWLRRLTGRRWLWYIPPAHLHYFTPKSLALLLEQEGFTVRKMTSGASTYLFFLVYYLLPSRLSENPSVVMPRWLERAVYAADSFLRLSLSPVLLWGQLRTTNPLIDVYAVPANKGGETA